MSDLMAVTNNKCYNFLYYPNSELCKTIFSNKDKSSNGKSALIKAWTVTETSSTFLDSGKADETTYSIIAFLCSFSTSKTIAQTSLDYLSTKYLAYNLYKAFLFVTSINSLSHWPHALL